MLAAVVMALALSAGSGQSGASPARGDRADTAGPLDLARVRVDQRERGLAIEVRSHEPLPALAGLRRRPPRVGAEDQRYLCIALTGPKVGRSLLCPGGEVRHERVEIGRSSVGHAGTATRRGGFEARIVERGARALSLRFPLRAAGLEPGRIRWRVLSAWTGGQCAESACLDTAPDEGAVSARIFPLRVAGCTSRRGVFNNGSRGGKRVALTFDDGPSAYTPAVIEILDRYGAKGTFFVLGSQIRGHEKVLRKALEHGHEVGNHSTGHALLPSLSDLRQASDRIEAATGFRPCTFRPPYGALNSSLVGDAQALGMSTVRWDVDTSDWTRPGSGAIYAAAVGAGAGSIVLMHDGGGDRSQTVAALPGIVKTLQSRGYRLVTVTKLLGGRFTLEEVHD